jgi:hypothetical protein
MKFQLSAFLTLSSCLLSDAIVWKDTGIKLPSAVSDMTVSEVAGRIIIAGGCVSGNNFLDENVTEYPGYYCTDVTSDVYEFDPDPNVKAFTKMASLSSPRYRHAAAVWEDKLYLIGGKDVEENYVTSVEVFDPETESWSEFTQLTDDQLRVDHAAVAYNGKIYVLGGYDEFYEAYTEMFSIDINNKNIVNLSPMLTAKGDAPATLYELNGKMKIVSVGGFTHANDFCAPLDEAEIYDFEKDEWTSISPLNEARGDMGIAELNGVLYTIGGESKHESYCAPDNNVDASSASIAVDDVESLDPRKGDNVEWSIEADLKSFRYRAAAAVLKETDTIYLFGGQTAYSHTCDCFAASDSVFTFTNASSVSNSVKIGIGVGVGILVLGLLVMGGIYLRKRRMDSKNKRRNDVSVVRANVKDIA